MEDKSKKNIISKNPPAGITIQKGMAVSIPKGGFKIKFDEDGALNVTVNVNVVLDVCPIWLEIAFQHLLDAENYKHSSLIAKQQNNKELLFTSLEGECRASMQAIMAAAIALDAYYSNIKDRVEFDKKTTKMWQDNNSARYKQIAQVMQYSFEMKGNEVVKKLNSVLKEIFRYRDLAVHPSGVPRKPVLHDELEIATEWRFVAFSSHNSKEIVRGALNLINQVSKKPRDKFPRLKIYCEGTIALVTPLLDKWKEHFGQEFK